MAHSSRRIARLRRRRCFVDGGERHDGVRAARGNEERLARQQFEAPCPHCFLAPPVLAPCHISPIFVLVVDITFVVVDVVVDVDLSDAKPPKSQPTGVSCAALFLIGALTSFPPLTMEIYIPSLPAITAQLHTTPTLTLLTISIFTGTFGVIQLVMGPAGSGKSTFCHVIQEHCDAAEILQESAFTRAKRFSRFSSASWNFSASRAEFRFSSE